MTISNSSINRRDMLKAAGVAAVGVVGSTLPGGAAFGATAPTKVLVFLKVSDLPGITSADTSKIAKIEAEIVSLAKPLGYTVTVTTDGSQLTAARVASFDIVVFYTTGNPAREAGVGGKPISAAGQDAVLKALASGKALIAMHCGLRQNPAASAAVKKAALAKPVDPYAQILTDLKDIAGALPLLWAGKASGFMVSDQKAKALGGTIGKTPLPLHIVSVQWQDGTDIKTRRPILTLLFASTSPLLKRTLQFAK